MSINIYNLLIGKTALIEGQQLTVVEILTQEEKVILEDSLTRASFQENQYGDVHRRGAQTHAISLRSEIQPEKLHPVLRHFLSETEQQQADTCLSKNHSA